MSHAAIRSDDRPEPHVAAPRKSRFREQVLAALLTQPTIEAAANTVGIGERTVRRWLAEKEFAEQFAAARKQALDDAVLCLQRATTDAVATLCRHLNSGDPGIEVRAANAILTHSLRWEELHALKERVVALEERARLADRL